MSDATPIRPERLCREITKGLPEGAVVVADTGHSTLWSATMIELIRPGQQYVRCFGTMGWAFPGSLGVKCALPDGPVLCFTGDGGICYHLAELETAARHRIATVVVVNNNAALGQVKVGLDRRHRDKDWGDPREVYAFQPVSYAEVARAMGCLGMRVEKPEQIGPALREAFAAGRPVVVDVVTDVDAGSPD